MRAFLGLIVAIWGASGALAVQNYCERGFKPVPGSDYTLDMSKLNKEFRVSQELSTPPTVTTTVVELNICDELTRPDNAGNDYCEKGAYACRRILNKKNDDVRVIEVQHIAGNIGSGKLDPELTLMADKDGKTETDLSKDGVSYALVLKGGKVRDQPQSAIITLECASSQNPKDDPPSPSVTYYGNNLLSLHWKTVFACATPPGKDLPDNGGNNDQPNQGGMSGAGIFFTVVGSLIAFYFVAGVLYNFKVYNARGADLIPHRDFWLDLPYLIRDLIAHVVDSIMSRRRGSGGYVAV
ncbi:autophagy-related protein 27 [Radiomyces spectabilis]|uniref:autophagy-related protein 27 n=1 Tax=Radiomyces spectabilis TaxID=64574 RepID=UPI00221E95E2|nr:autophagy-related protein 27 [Radiomyces spectabilis]KAI8372764.1 autophagy-related protein 27 [Radiomyces spectabilis]